MTIESPAKPDLSNRLDELIAEEEAIFVARQPRSRELRRQAEADLLE